MDETIKAKWVAALRSGKYKQGFGFLNYRDKYCCLGVLCDVIDSSKWLLGVNGLQSYNSQTQKLTDEMLKTVGLDVKTQRTLITLNDREQRSFDSIANYIERNL